MIRSLRRRHLSTFALLAVALPAAYLVALGARAPMPRVETLPTAFDSGATSGRSFSSGGPVTIEPLGLVARSDSHWSDDDGQHVVLSIGIAGDGAAPAPIPDPLVYRCESAGGVGEGLPSFCRFVGALRDASRQELPVPDSSGEGEHLVIYSLAQQRVVGAGPWPIAPQIAEPPRERN